MRMRDPSSRPTPPWWVAQYWWALCAVGVVLLGIGIALHTSPIQRGGPIMLGFLLLLAGVLGSARKSAAGSAARGKPAR
jgi:uncharacterized protein (TIGR03382 family)